MVLKREFKKRQFAHKYAQKAVNHQAASTWEEIEEKEQSSTFALFFKKYQENNYLTLLKENKLFIEKIPEFFRDKELYEEFADQICSGKYSFLGTELFGKKNTEIPWHRDTKSSDLKSFIEYKNIFFEEIRSLLSTQNNGLSKETDSSCKHDNYGADIKIPWERSRLQHLFILSWAILHNSQKSDLYTKIIIEQISHWLNENPFLLGVNWLNPMEVALRAISLCWAFEAIKTSDHCSISFAQRLSCSLYDHLTYLNAQWELSDKPNNHYIADLTGALYLTLFFKEFPLIKQQIADVQEALNKQYKQQILADGTSYEGSTAYHRLVTEMHLHYTLLAQAYGLQLSPEHQAREEALFDFLNDCTVGKTFITIGDDDSGKVLTGLAYPDLFNYYKHESPQANNKEHYTTINHPEKKEKTEKDEQRWFPRFGLIIIKKNDWHLTLREQSFAESQPTGHFHDDELSITLFYKEIPIIVDPGSYCYSGDPILRHFLRSAAAHSTIRIVPRYELKESYPKELFSFHKKSNQPTDSLNKAYFFATEPLSYTVTRELFSESDQVIIKDQLTMPEQKSSPDYQIRTSFLFHPAITLVQRKIHEWLIVYNKESLLKITTSHSFTVHHAWFAPSYGIKTSCLQLASLAELSTNHNQIITISNLV